MNEIAPERFGLSGLLIARIVVENPEEAQIEGLEGDDTWTQNLDGLWASGLLVRRNAFVNTGLNISLDRLFALSGPPAAVSHFGVSGNNDAVTPTTIYLNGATAGAAGNTMIKVISPAATRSNQTVTAGATFTQADVNFAIRKVGLLNTPTDAGTGLVDVVGGSGGVAPYDKPLTIDLTGAGTWSLTLQLQITAQAV